MAYGQAGRMDGSEVRTGLARIAVNIESIYSFAWSKAANYYPSLTMPRAYVLAMVRNAVQRYAMNAMKTRVSLALSART